MPIDQPHQHLHIRNQLAADIVQGALQVKLPSERGLTERFLYARIALRETLQQPGIESLVYHENRHGQFVTPPQIRYNPARTAGFMEYISAQGRQPRTEILCAERRTADTWPVRWVGPEDSTPVYFLQQRH